MTSNAQKGKKCGSTEGGNRVEAVIRAPAGREEAARTGELDIQNLARIFCEAATHISCSWLQNFNFT